MQLGSFRARRRGVLAVLVLAALAIVAAVTGSSTASTQQAPGAAYITITDFVKYVGGKPGKANPKLSPVKIGWSNNEGGSIIPAAAEATPAAEVAVKWINAHASGIGGHPLVLEKCLVKNSEDEGLKCGQKFLNDPSINVISYGALPIGATSINATVAGKKPIVTGFALNPSDIHAKNTYILFIAGDFSVYSWGEFARTYLKAKTASVLYPEQPGLKEIGAAVVQANTAANVKTKLVGYDPNSTDLLGALTAAGAQSAGSVFILAQGEGQCLALAQGMQQLGIKPGKVISFTNCLLPSIQSKYPGGDYQKWIYGISQSGDVLANTATGKAFVKAETEFGHAKDVTNPWFTGMFGSIMTIAKFLNTVGPDKLTPQAVAAQAKAFKGPLLLGGPVVECGKYTKFPTVCTGGQSFFTYLGNEKYKRISGWVLPPVALQKKFGAKVK